MGSVAKDITGQRFGRLVALLRMPTEVKNGNHRSRWLCRCDCGNTKSVELQNLQKGNVSSCGCLRIETVRAAITHGHTRVDNHTSEYNTWIMMKQRCTNPNNPHYADYGGRGIKVCKQWLESFEVFINDVGLRPIGKSVAGRSIYSLNRIDNDGDYEPGNVEWATHSAQMKNRRWFSTKGKSVD